MVLASVTAKWRARGPEREWRALSSIGMVRRASSRPILPQIACVAGIAALSASGCTTTTDAVTSSSAGLAAPAAFGRERLVGRWGIASFHNDKDRKRTEGEARAQCGLPYTISRGPTDGVMMHVADDPKGRVAALGKALERLEEDGNALGLAERPDIAEPDRRRRPPALHL